MARNRPHGTLVDYLVAAIEPVLIMIMVGSLMFFLLDLWYEGPVLDRLRWILFWFVFGIVLITRVSMQIGSSLATKALRYPLEPAVTSTMPWTWRGSSPETTPAALSLGRTAAGEVRM